MLMFVSKFKIRAIVVSDFEITLAFCHDERQDQFRNVFSPIYAVVGISSATLPPMHAVGHAKTVKGLVKAFRRGLRKRAIGTAHGSFQHVVRERVLFVVRHLEFWKPYACYLLYLLWGIEKLFALLLDFIRTVSMTTYPNYRQQQDDADGQHGNTYR